MARKSRAAPPTIAQMRKLEAVYKAKQDAHYEASRKFSEYKERVEELGAGYSEVVDGVTYVIAITPERYGQGTTMTIVEVKSR